MSSLNWNALWTLATALVVCVLPFVSLPSSRTRALLHVRAESRKDRRRQDLDAR